jgi:hypothetical protein
VSLRLGWAVSLRMLLGTSGCIRTLHLVPVAQSNRRPVHRVPGVGLCSRNLPFTLRCGPLAHLKRGSRETLDAGLPSSPVDRLPRGGVRVKLCGCRRRDCVCALRQQPLCAALTACLYGSAPPVGSPKCLKYKLKTSNRFTCAQMANFDIEYSNRDEAYTTASYTDTKQL